MNLAIICDLNPKSGLGHIRRMRSLYDALIRYGNNCFFLFPLVHRDFVKKYTTGLQVNYFEADAPGYDNSYVNFAKSHSISIVIIDSYKNTYPIEKLLSRENIFSAVIDDHVRSHCSNLT